jgi:hypothetical protein
MYLRTEINGESAMMRERSEKERHSVEMVMLVKWGGNDNAWKVLSLIGDGKKYSRVGAELQAGQQGRKIDHGVKRSPILTWYHNSIQVVERRDAGSNRHYHQVIRPKRRRKRT